MTRKEIKTRLKVMGMKQGQLAQDLGISSSALSAFICGKRHSARIERKLAKFFDVDVSEIRTKRRQAVLLKRLARLEAQIKEGVSPNKSPAKDSEKAA